MPRLVSSRALLLLVDRPTGPGPVVLGNVRLSLGQEVEQEKQRTGAESLLAEEGLGVTGPSGGKGLPVPRPCLEMLGWLLQCLGLGLQL